MASADCFSEGEADVSCADEAGAVAMDALTAHIDTLRAEAAHAADQRARDDLDHITKNYWAGVEDAYITAANELNKILRKVTDLRTRFPEVR